MSESTASLKTKIASAGDLQSVVRTMKTMAAANIGQYENAVLALAAYERTVELGLAACFRASDFADGSEARAKPIRTRTIAAIVFGSEQGLVGQFNELIADFAAEKLALFPAHARIWVVGERVYARLADAGLPLSGLFAVPKSVDAITPLVGQILLQIDAQGTATADAEMHLFYNTPSPESVYFPATLRLLPLDEAWRRRLIKLPWPTHLPPQIVGAETEVLSALIREYLFASLFRASVESLASENASRLAAMERADRNIDQLLTDLRGTFHRLRQSGIDAELFDVISGFEALTNEGDSSRKAFGM